MLAASKISPMGMPQRKQRSRRMSFGLSDMANGNITMDSIEGGDDFNQASGNGGCFGKVKRVYTDYMYLLGAVLLLLLYFLGKNICSMDMKRRLAHF